MSYLTADLDTGPRPGEAELREYSAKQPTAGMTEAERRARDRILYIRSYLFMRAMIGFIGIALPIVLVIGNGLFVHGDLGIRSSLSGYYHSGMRDVFVGSLCAIGVFLIAYKVFEHNLDNTLSVLAGLSAFVVALFPTGLPSNSDTPLTPLQQRFGEVKIEVIHYTSASVFIISLAAMSYFFGVREGNRSQVRGGERSRFSPTFWRWFHWGCTILIGLAIAFVVITQLGGWLKGYSLLIGEVVVVLAFGASWLAKGLELRVLRIPD
ncbi:MAG: hypothetical protein ACRDWG_14330 [Actinomycetes bacterium]